MSDATKTNGQNVPAPVADRMSGKPVSLSPFMASRERIRKSAGKKPAANYGYKTEEGAVTLSLSGKPRSRRVDDVAQIAQLVGVKVSTKAPEDSSGMSESLGDTYVKDEAARMVRELFADARAAREGVEALVKEIEAIEKS